MGHIRSIFFKDKHKPSNHIVDKQFEDIESKLNFLEKHSKTGKERNELDLGIIEELQKAIAKVKDVGHRDELYKTFVDLLRPIAEFHPKLHSKIGYLSSKIEGDHSEQPRHK